MAGLGVLVTSGIASGATRATVDSDAERVLQSVSVTMDPDGTLTDVEGTVVESGSDDDATTTSYDPAEVVDKLPVRILTAYRTKDGAGTDLSDLKGYDGRVRIDLTVQNLTVQPQLVTYDAGGTSRSQAAPVGAPLTVVASASLGDTEPSAVVTKDSSTAGDDVTNGVLSQDGDGNTQVQWATILAPPQLSSTATLSLVVDAKDFDAPAFDLSVQPGLVTDPSVGALVDAAFNPKASSELELQSRTIQLIGDMNVVLDRASETISNVRTTLDSTSETLGTKTVGDLKSSASSVASSMQGLKSTTTALGSQLSTALESTRSSALEQLALTVAAVDRVLGDTSAEPEPAKLTGDGCAATVKEPTAGKTVYANLVKVVGQLDGYARAAEGCKAEIQRKILNSVGPEEPSPETCVTASVTCALYGVKGSFQEIADKLVDDGDKALARLEPQKVTDVVTATDTLSAAVTKVYANATALLAATPFYATDNALRQIKTSLAGVRNTVGGVSAAIGLLHDRAAAARGETSAMDAQNIALANKLCTLIGNNQANMLSEAQVNDLRASLVTTSCPDGSGNSHPISNGSVAMANRIANQAGVWDTILADTAVADTTRGTGKALADLTSSIDRLDKQIDDALTALNNGTGDVAQLVTALLQNMTDLTTARNQVQAAVDAVKGQEDDVLAAVKKAFHDAAKAAKDGAADALDPQIRQVFDRTNESSEELGDMFEQSEAGLSAAATAIRKNGAATLKKQKAEFARQEKAASQQVSAEVEHGLAAIAQGVGSSTRDMEAAGALLAKDLSSVLLDLGDRRVHGSGLLGAMSTGAATARTATYQLALATGKASSYANVRGEDVAEIYLRQAQADAALQRQAELPAFGLELPAGTLHRTVYSFHIEAAQ